MRNQAPMVSPIQEVTEPNTATATPLGSVTPTSEMTCITPTNDEPGDEDYGDGYGSDEPGNDLVDSFSEDVPSLKSQSQSGMPTESTIFFQEAEMKIEQEIQKEEEDAFEAEERRIAAEIEAGKIPNSIDKTLSSLRTVPYGRVRGSLIKTKMNCNAKELKC